MEEANKFVVSLFFFLNFCLVNWQLKVMQQTIEELNKEQESLIDIFAEERDRREREEENLRKKIKVSSLSFMHFIILSETLNGTNLCE